MNWSGFYDGIRPEIPASEPALVDATLRRAAIEFCEETGIYILDFTPVNIVANTAAYTLTSPTAFTEAMEIKHAWANDVPITPISQEDLAKLPGRWTNDTSTLPTNYTQQDDDNVILYPRPTVSYTAGLVMKVAVRPTIDATGIVDWFANKYYYDLSAGCKAMMMEMKGKPWSSPEGAAQFRAQFEGGKTSATIEANRSFTRAQVRVRMSRTW